MLFVVESQSLNYTEQETQFTTEEQTEKKVTYCHKLSTNILNNGLRVVEVMRRAEDYSLKSEILATEQSMASKINNYSSNSSCSNSDDA